MTRVFVSYRREDSAYVAATIKEKLEQRFGQNSVFFDIDTIPLGTDFRRHISDAVGECDVLIAIIGDTWSSAVDDQGHRRLDNPTDSVRLEIEAALARDIPIIPVLVGKARMPAMDDLPSTLQDIIFRNSAEVRPGYDLQQHLRRLVTGIEKALEAQHPKQAVQELPKADKIEDSAAADEKSANVSPDVRESNVPPPFRMRWLLFPLVIVATLVIVLFGLVDAKISVPAAFIISLAGVILAYQIFKHS